MTNLEDGVDQTHIKALIADTQTWVNDVLEKVGWDEDHILQGEEAATCPLDAAHTVPRSRMEEHLKLCPLLQKGYTKEELDEEQSSKPFYEKSTKVMSIDLSDDTVRGILSRFSPAAAGGATVRDLPLTQLRAASSLTSEEHLAVYEYCLETVKVANRQATFQEDELQLLEDDQEDGDSEPKSRLEMLAAERDLKRRRQAYRGKNVHTANKSYTEVIGEVIAKQVEILTRRCQRQQKAEERDKRKERSSRHGNVQRDADKKKKRHRKSRSRSRSKERSGSPDHHRKHKHKKKHKRDRENADRKSSGVKEERAKVKDERSP